MIYFDHAASGVMYPEVSDLVFKAQKENYSNPSSKHILGTELDEGIEEARAQFLKLLGGSPKDDFIFTSGATESNNTVIRGLDLKTGDVIVYSRADHASVTAPVSFMGNEKKVEYREILLNEKARVDLDHFQSILDEKVKLVILTHVNNQSGVILDILSIAKMVKEKTSAHVHVDAVQSFGKLPLKLSSNIDSMSITSHKIGGPKGVAGLFMRNHHGIKPLIMGGGQEKGFRSGTQPYPLIMGFSLAAKMSVKEEALALKRVASLSERVHFRIKEIVPGVIFPFDLEKSPYIISFIIPQIASDIILRHLERERIYVSTTSACSSRIPGFNQSLAALNIPEKYHKNFLRISLGPKTTELEVEEFGLKFKKVWDSLCNHI